MKHIYNSTFCGKCCNQPASLEFVRSPSEQVFFDEETDRVRAEIEAAQSSAWKATLTGDAASALEAAYDAVVVARTALGIARASGTTLVGVEDDLDNVLDDLAHVLNAKLVSSLVPK